MWQTRRQPARGRAEDDQSRRPQLDDVCLDGEPSLVEFGVQAARVGEGVGEEDLAVGAEYTFGEEPGDGREEQVFPNEDVGGVAGVPRSSSPMAVERCFET